jgi:hypothetical protein
MNTTDADNAITEATLTQWTWKTPAMKRMTLAVARLAIERGINGEFSANDLTIHGQDEQGGSGIAGSVFRQLVGADIIAPVGKFVDGQFYPKIVLNHCKNKIGVYRLAKPGLARALIRIHDTKPPPSEPVQLDLISNLQSPIPNQPA